MYLQKIEYHLKGENDWQLQSLELGRQNLIVGKNGTGKSKTIHAIDHFAKILQQKDSPAENLEVDASFVLDDGKVLQYSFSYTEGIIDFELLIFDGNLKVRRSEWVTEIYFAQSGEMGEVFPPKDLLVLHSRRDQKEYPYFEPLANWAATCAGFRFSHEGAHPVGNYVGNSAFRVRENYLTAHFKEFTDEVRHALLNDLRSLGFDFERIVLQETGEREALLFFPGDLPAPIYLRELSQGIFRAFSILTVLHQRIQGETGGTQLIDDLCEGLDYERATKLGELVFRLAEENAIQLIVSSNDSFLMDVVNIKKWNVLVRNGTIISSINYFNSKEKFEQFKYSGLSNFDFFATDYLLEKA